MAVNKAEKIILGIDPGTNVMGYGVLRVNGNKAKMEAMGVIDLRKMHDPYLRLGHIFERVTGIIESYLPDELAIEAPFFGKNVQSMLKLGRAQGVAIAAAIRLKWLLRVKVKRLRSRWQACCSVCCILRKKTCQDLWMQRMLLLQPIAIFCKWEDPKLMPDITAAGKTLS